MGIVCYNIFILLEFLLRLIEYYFIWTAIAQAIYNTRSVKLNSLQFLETSDGSRAVNRKTIFQDEADGGQIGSCQSLGIVTPVLSRDIFKDIKSFPTFQYQRIHVSVTNKLRIRNITQLFRVLLIRERYIIHKNIWLVVI